MANSIAPGSSLGSSSVEVAEVAQAQSPASPTFRMLDLPTELVLSIISCMDHGEAILFSLASRAARDVVSGASYGKSSLDALNDDPAKRLAFLELLARDLPYHFVCRRCRKLHSHRRLLEDDDPDARHGEPPAMSHRRLDPARKGLLTFGPLWPQYAFSIDDARAAVSQQQQQQHHHHHHHHHHQLLPRLGRYRQPAHPVPQLSLRTPWKLARLGASCGNPELLYGYAKLDAEAVWTPAATAAGGGGGGGPSRTGRLCLHKAQRVLVRPDRAPAFLRRGASAPPEHVFRPCPHDVDGGGGGLWSAFAPLELLPAARRPPRGSGSGSGSVLESVSALADRVARRYGLDRACGPEGWDASSISDHLLPGCAFCMTETVLTIHNHGREGVEIILDAYQDLGDCAAAAAAATASTGEDSNWLVCCSRDTHIVFQNATRRRQVHPAVDLSMFPTRAGKSAQGDPSAPSAKDIWELHEHERRARLALAS
ncbi:hypothetical protein Hte_011342 [Hypoxylon texense]